jgi:hypothetical protein
MGKPEDRLDASETMFFRDQLRSIDSRVYKVELPLLKGRMLLPPVSGISPNARSYSYRMVETFGKAKIIADGTNDLPKVTATGSEFTSLIKELGVSYDFGFFEIRAAAEAGVGLPDEKARAARTAIEEAIDNLIAFGDAAHNMVGFANHASVSTVTPTTKAAGGTTWLSSGNPNATAREMVADVNLLVNTIWSALKEAQGLPDRVTVVLPSLEYAHLATAPMGDNADKTALSYLVSNNQRLAEVVPWHKLDGAGVGPSNRAIGYVKDPVVVGSVIPMEYTPRPAQERGLAFEVPAVARCGGAVVRYAAAIRYMDNI